jgi:hypothetical protein
MSVFFFLMVVQAIVAALLVGVILMQKSEGGGLGTGGSPSGFMSARGAADFLLPRCRPRSIRWPNPMEPLRPRRRADRANSQSSRLAAGLAGFSFHVQLERWARAQQLRVRIGRLVELCPQTVRGCLPRSPSTD